MVHVTLNVYTNVYTNFNTNLRADGSLLLTFAGLRNDSKMRSLA